MRHSELVWAPIAQRLVRPLLIVPLDPHADHPPRLSKGLKLMLPDTLFFETAKEAFDDAVLLRRVRRDELLRHPIVPTGCAKAPALKDQPIVTVQDRRRSRPQRPEPRQARRFYRRMALLLFSRVGSNT